MGYYFRDKNLVWKIRWDDVPGPNGERRQRTKSMRKLGNSEAAAKKELRRVETAVDDRLNPDGTTLTLGQYLDRWYEDFALQQHHPTTQEGEKRQIELHIKPILGGIPLPKLRPLDHIQALYKQLGKKGYRGGNGLSPKTIKNVHGVLHSALKQAVLWQLIDRNPADGVVLPRSEKSDKRAATPEELGKLMNRIETSRFRIPILIAMETGMRCGEIVGLRWEDMFERDLNGQKIHGLMVRRAAAFTQALGTYVKDTKTAAGTRTVVITPELAEQLREHRKAQMLKASDQECGYQDQGWICPSPDGSLMRPRKLTQAFIYIAGTLNINLTIHELRHTQASVLGSKGVFGPVISDRVGWVDQSMMTVYGHSTLEMQQSAVTVMSDFLGEARELAKKLSATS
jgi:integrase